MPSVGKYRRKDGIAVKQEEKKTIGWEVTDPKPPVVQSIDKRRQY